MRYNNGKREQDSQIIHPKVEANCHFWVGPEWSLHNSHYKIEIVWSTQQGSLHKVSFLSPQNSGTCICHLCKIFYLILINGLWERYCHPYLKKKKNEVPYTVQGHSWGLELGLWIQICLVLMLPHLELTYVNF